MELRQEVLGLLERCVSLRRRLHQIPETGYEEIDTQRFVLERLEACRPDRLETLAGTGVRAVFFAPEAKETIAFRADMDALNITEENETDYVSQRPGKMHACGHDGHMTMLLLLAELVSRHRDEMTKNVVLLFQPAEEGGGGAKRMIEAGALQDPPVDRIYGIHIWPSVPKGKIGVRWGPMMAQTLEFDIIVHGRSAHGASPQLGVDAVVVAAELIGLLQTAITRNLDPHEDALLTIGKISGGTARNIIADKVTLNATLRVFSSSVYAKLSERIRDMLQGLTLATGATFEFKKLMQYPCVDNPAPWWRTSTGMWTCPTWCWWSRPWRRRTSPATSRRRRACSCFWGSAAARTASPSTTAASTSTRTPCCWGWRSTGGCWGCETGGPPVRQS